MELGEIQTSWTSGFVIFVRSSNLNWIDTRSSFAIFGWSTTHGRSSSQGSQAGRRSPRQMVWSAHLNTSIVVQFIGW